MSKPAESPSAGLDGKNIDETLLHGANQSYCSTATAATIADVENFPAELRALPQWVTWRYVHNHNGPKPRKIPFTPKTGKAASTTDPTQWGTLKEAIKACESDSDLEGIGFVFSAEDPYCGVDLDNCFDPDSGQHKPVDIGKGRTLDPSETLKQLRSYTELSPSGTGFHVIVKASLSALTGNKRASFECYDQERFFTVTGRRFGNTPSTVEARQAAVNALHARVWPPEKSKGNGKTKPVGAVSLDDAALLDKARNAANGTKFSALYDRGDWQGQGYPSQSEADLALCCDLAFWTDRDTARMDRLFRQSGLMRDKWDSRRGDTTLGALTIAKAIERTAEGYKPRIQQNEHTAAPPNHELPPLEAYTQPSNTWSDPQPLPEPGDTTAAEFPDEALPDPLLTAAQEVARFAKVPLVSPATVGLSVTATAISKRACIIERKGLNHWPAQFFTLVTKSGERKSDVFRNMLRPVTDWVESQIPLYESAKREAGALNDAIDASIQGIKSRAKAKDGDPQRAAYEIEALLKQKRWTPPHPRLHWLHWLHKRGLLCYSSQKNKPPTIPTTSEKPWKSAPLFWSTTAV